MPFQDKSGRFSRGESQGSKKALFLMVTIPGEVYQHGGHILENYLLEHLPVTLRKQFAGDGYDMSSGDRDLDFGPFKTAAARTKAIGQIKKVAKGMRLPLSFKRF